MPYRIDPTTGQKVFINAGTGQINNAMPSQPVQSPQMQQASQVQTPKFDMGSYMQSVMSTLTKVPNTQVQNPSVGGFAGNVARDIGNMATGAFGLAKTVAQDVPLFAGRSINQMQGETALPMQDTAKMLPQFVAGVVNGFYKLGKATETRDTSGNVTVDPMQSIKNLGGLAYNEPVETAGTIASAVPIAKGITKLSGGGSKMKDFKSMTNEQFIEKYGGWKNAGDRVRFDKALFAKDAKTVKEMLPDVPADYAQRFSTEISNLVGKGGRSVKVAPFGKGYDPKIATVAQKYGIDLPVSAQTSSKVVRGLEATAQKGIFGEKTAKGIDVATDQLNLAKTNLIKDIDTATDLKGLGTVIKKGFEGYTDDFNRTKTALYNKAKNPALASTPVDVSSTQSVLENIVNTKSQSLAGDATAGFYDDLLNNMKGKPITFEQLKETRKVIGNKLGNVTDPIATGDKGSLQRLYASMSDDMDNAMQLFDPDTFGKLQKANTYYKEMINKINSSIGTKIANKDPEKLLDDLVRPNSETAITQVKEVIGLKATKSLQGQFTAKLLNESLDKNGFINSTLLEKNIAKYTEPTIKALLDDAQMEKLNFIRNGTRELSTVENALKSGIKPAEGSQTAFLGKYGLLGASIFRPDIALGILLSDLGLNKLFQSGFGKDLLTKGLTPTVPTIPTPSAGTVSAIGMATKLPQDVSSDVGGMQDTAKDGVTPSPFGSMSKQDILTDMMSKGATSSDLTEFSKSYDIITNANEKLADTFVDTTVSAIPYSPAQLATAMIKARSAGDTKAFSALKDMYDIAVAEEKRLTTGGTDANTKKRINAIRGAEIIYKQMEDLALNAPTGVWGKIRAETGTLPGVEGGSAEDLKRQTEGFAKAIASAFAGEVGVATDRDVERWLGLMPKVGDTMAERKRALARLKTQIDANKKAYGIE